ncbi:hypothetical protein HGB13_00455 [bacterium]|nr:hypothetical protein [bacterium]
MMLSKSVENKIKKEAINFLRQGKEGWDIPHTLSAVKWMKVLIEKEGGDDKILIPAIYFHDTGYQQLPLDCTPEEVKKAHLGHAEKGSLIASKVLPKLNDFSDKEIIEITRLISAHDKHPALDDFNHQLVFEADGLAQIDWQNCKPTYSKKNSSKFLNESFIPWRVKYYKTKTGKKYLDKLIMSAKKYLKE